MLHPSSLWRRIPTSIRRRPSAAMLVALTALFLAIGGVGYAAVTLPAGSVGTAQLRTFSVTNSKLASSAVGYRKIIPGTIGAVRIDKNAVQVRVGGRCTAPNQAMTSVQNTGRVTCGVMLPSEFDASSATAAGLTSATTATPVISEPLPGGSSYLVMAAPYIQVSGTAGIAQHVAVDCTLAAGPSTSASQTRSVSFDLSSAHESESGSIPLAVAAGPSSTSITAQVSCTATVTGGGTAPKVSASGALNALQTASNTTAPTPTTTSTTTTPTTTSTTTTPTTTTTTTTTTG